MYTNAIIGSYNTIANSEHGAMIMKPPIRRQPKKSHSKEGHTPSTRGNSEESPSVPTSQQSGANSVNSVLSPTSLHSLISPSHPPTLPGLEILANVSSVLVQPDKIFSPEVSKISFKVDEAGITPEGKEAVGPPRPLLQCVPTEGANSRSLSLQTLEGRTILQIHTHTPYCCSWYQDLESKISLPNGDSFGSILKTAHGPCKCHRKFVMTCRKDGGSGAGENNDKVQFEVEVLLTPTELLIKENSEVVAKVGTRGLDCRTAYKVTFVKERELSPSFKALFIAFAINLHIAFAEKLNTCFGMGLCCFAGSSVAAWIMCVV